MHMNIKIKRTLQKSKYLFDLEAKMNLRVKKFFWVSNFYNPFNLLLSKKEFSDKNYNNFKATFNKIDGVNVGTDVVISGIKVGYVQEVFIKKYHSSNFFL